MDEDDLLLTNEFMSDSQIQESNKKDFDKLLKGKDKSSEIYDPNKPEFLNKKNYTSEKNIGFSENSLAFEQYIKFAQTDKRKKIKKTILNIDSRNRVLEYKYDDKKLLQISDQDTIFFEEKSNQFIVKLETNYVKDINFFNQIIFSKLLEKDFEKVGISKDNFEFNKFDGAPIFSILKFIFNDGIKETEKLFDDSKKAYKFNKLILNIPGNINISEIKRSSTGKNSEITIITNVKISYPTPSHYSVNLGRTFSNIYGIRLVSAEIPNTSYTFNENLIESNFGKYNLTTVVNNKLRWINKMDRIKTINYSVNSGNIFFKNMPYLPISKFSEQQSKNFDKNQDSCNINLNSNLIKSCSTENIDINNTILTLDNVTLNNDDLVILKDQIDQKENGIYKYLSLTNKLITLIDLTNPANILNYVFNNQFYIYQIIGGLVNKNKNFLIKKAANNIYFKNINLGENFRRFNTIYRISNQNNQDTNFNTVLDIKNRDYYFNSLYVGNLENKGIIQNENYNITDTVFFLNKNILKTLYEVYTPFNLYVGENIILTNSEYSFTYFEFINNFQLKIHLYSGNLSDNHNDYIEDYIKLQKLPNKIKFIGLNSNNIYIFSLYQIGNNIATEVTTGSVPRLKKTYIFDLIPIEGNFINNGIPFNSLNEKIMMVNYNPIKNDDLINLKKYNKYLLTFIENYYSKNESMLYTNLNWDSTNYNIQKTYSSDSRNFTIEFKTMYTYYYSNNRVFMKDGILNIYEFDIYGNKRTELGIIPIDYPYIKLDDHFYIVDTDKPIIKNLNYYQIHLLTNWQTIVDTSINHTILFQKKNLEDIEYIYINKIIQGNILRFYDKDNLINYVEFYVGKNTNTQTYQHEIKYKRISGDFDIFKSNLSIQIFSEYIHTYFRESSGMYLYSEIDNNNLNNDNILEKKYINGLDNLNFSTDNKIFENFEKNIEKKNFSTDIIDVPDYSIVGLTKKIVKNGLNETNFSKEYLEISDLNNESVYPKINSDTNKIIDAVNLNLNSDEFYIKDLKSIEKYPIYELNIDSSKYTEVSLKKYLDAKMNKIKTMIYDYGKEIFIEDTNTVKKADLDNEMGINQDSKFTITFNNSVNSVFIKQYKKIFNSHKSESIDSLKVAFVNEGFPYIYYKIPSFSLPNGSIVLLQNTGSIDNIKSRDLSTEHNIIIPPNYKIKIRQLMPLPFVDGLNNKVNLFSKKGGYVKSNADRIYNKFVDYINHANNPDGVKDLSLDFIIKRIFGLGESNLTNVNDLDENKLSKMNSDFNFNKMPINKNTINKSGLKSSYIDNHGKNQKYEQVKGYNNSNKFVSTDNISGIEYIGQAHITGFQNEIATPEFFDEMDLVGSGYTGNDGFQTNFKASELFMRVNDINKSFKNNVIGRIKNIDNRSDKFGNLEVDYDLFSENYENFRIGDIVIGLDTNSIGVIIPYDYNYSTLPNIDLISLGLGAYLLNKCKDAGGPFIDKYLSLTNANTKKRDLAKKFLNNINSWQIQKNNTSSGFYIYSPTIPFKSKLEGTITSTLEIYQPKFFKFLENNDTALDKLGLTNSYYNNKFNYFKTNYESSENSEIKRSFFNIAKNNGIFTSYLIIETKEVGDFKVNDRIYLEDHKIIANNASFRKERFFKVKLLENYSSFLSKLETIYYNSILNFNGLSLQSSLKIGNNEQDNKYLKDYEYKSKDTPGNSYAKGDVIIDAYLYELSIDGQENNKSGKGYLGVPTVTVDTSDGTRAQIYVSELENGVIKKLNIFEKGNKYRKLPNIEIEPANVTATAIVSLTGSLITSVILTNKGSGYTQEPIITFSQSGVQAIVATNINGIGNINISKIIPIGINDEIEISPPNAGGSTALAYVSRINTNEFDKIVVYNSGDSYSNTENITVLHRYTDTNGIVQEVTDHFIPIVDGIGEITVDNNGSNYSATYPPGLTIINPNDNVISSKLVPVVVGSVLTELRVIEGGKNYSTTPSVTIDPPSALGKGILEIGVIKINILNGGSNYSTSTTVGFNVSGSGTGTIAYPIIENGVITNIIITNSGDNYGKNDTITINITDNTGIGASAEVVIGKTGRLSRIDVLYSGVGYTNNTASVTISPPKSDPDIVMYLSEGQLSDIRIDNRGTGYVFTPSVTLYKKGNIYNTTTTLTNNYGNVDNILSIVYASYEPFHINGYFPLYYNNVDSDLASIISTSTKFTFDSIDYFMPNGLVLNSTYFLGSYSPNGKIECTIGTGNIVELHITDRGFNYEDIIPSVTISAPDLAGGIQATASATVFAEQVIGLTIVEEGSGYIYPPTVTIFGAAEGRAVISNGSLKTVNIIQQPPDNITVIPIANFEQPYANAVTDGTIVGIVESISLYNFGENYITHPSISIDTPIPPQNWLSEGNTAINATGSSAITINNTSGDVPTGYVSSATISNSGNGYTSVPMITFSGPSENSKIVIPFNNKYVCRHLNENIQDFYHKYYLKYKNSITSPDEFRIEFIGNNISKIFIYKNLEKEITANSNNNLKIITIENNSGKKNIYLYDNILSEYILSDIRDINIFIEDEKYYIDISIYRLPISVDTINKETTDNYVGIYSTLGIFERLIDEQMNDIYNFMSFNITKASYLYKEYSYNIFKNRIVKLKVCSIDDKGFSCESADYLIDSNGKALNSQRSKRQVKGYCKKLFPYHEYAHIVDYKDGFDGDIPSYNSVDYKTYTRPKQKITNIPQDIRRFLPGMGVYSVEENSKVGEVSNTHHYDNLSNADAISLSYGEYTYTNNFLGYVLETSIDSNEEYYRNYVMNSDSFSKTNSSNSVNSEYYIYMLIDPGITSSEDMNELFNNLNKDNIHIVFDADAKNDYSIEPLQVDGILKSGYPYYVDSYSDLNNTSVATDEYIEIIEVNTYGHYQYRNDRKELFSYEDQTFKDRIPNTEIDPFSNPFTVCVRITKPKFNKKLKGYGYQKRLACATITERPVLYEIKNDLNSRKLFVSGEYDYFYKKEMKNKTVMRYDPVMSRKNIDSLNNKNIIIENNINFNSKIHNFKETNCHGGYLDSNINNKEEFYETGNKKNIEQMTVEDSETIYTMNKGDDIVLIDSKKKKVKFSDSKHYTNHLVSFTTGETETELIGINEKNIKVLTGSLLPSTLYFEHSKIYNNNLSKYVENTCLLDHKFTSDLEKSLYNSSIGKVRTNTIDIPGNNSTDYNLNNDSDSLDYNNLFIENIYLDNGIQKIQARNNVGNIIITNSNKNLLDNCILILSTYVKGLTETQPINKSNITELVVIESTTIDNNKLILTLKNKLVNEHNNNLTNENQKNLILYPTVTSNGAIEKLDDLGNYKIPISSDEPRFSNLEVNDYIMIDWGVKRKIEISTKTPYLIDNSYGKEYYTTKIYKILEKGANYIKINKPVINYPNNTIIIILKNHLDNKKGIKYNFLSTQPFVVNNKFYTKVFYKGAKSNIGKHYNNNYKIKKIIPNINGKYIEGGEKIFNRFFSDRIFIAGMKGIQVPFIDLNVNSEGTLGINGKTNLYSMPCPDNYYDMAFNLEEDFGDKKILPNFLKINGSFSQKIEDIGIINKIDHIKTIKDLEKNIWTDSDLDIEYPFIVIEGLYLGYGGFMEERFEEDIINTIINNDTGYNIKRITDINNKSYIYIQLSKTNLPILDDMDFKKNNSLINQSNRQNYLDYETNLKLLDEILESDPENYEQYLSIFGIEGNVVKKVIKSPYNLNPNKYVYLVIPNLNHINTVQNNDVDEAFAKILLPGESNKPVFNTFVASSKIYYNNLFNNLTDLEIAFITNEGHLFDFNGSEHSLAIEITEIIDKFEYINPRFGNIEI
jgi:hypothetical protein